MEVDEGRALLDRLLGQATKPERIYHHVWSLGDTIMWDNRGVLHRATGTAPTRVARCCAPPCWATSTSS